MRALVRDIRYGFRSLTKSPGITIAAVFALTLGIGLTTTMFSVVYAALIRGLPYPDGDRVMVMVGANPSRGIESFDDFTIPDYYDYKAQQRSFNDLAATSSGTMYVSGQEKAERFDGSWITANLFSVLGVKPILGRDFRPGEDSPQASRVAILSYAMWKDRYAGDQSIVGKVIRVNGDPTTVIGVMPYDFNFPENQKLWLPLQIDPLTTKRGEGRTVEVVGKLKPGVSKDAANVEVATIAARLAQTYPETNKGVTASVEGYIVHYINKDAQQLLLTMLGAVFFVLLIACANVANLLLDRAAHRTKEVGVRTALGASRAAIVRQFLAESLVLSMVATVLGIGLAYVGIDLFKRAIASQDIPSYIQIALHPQVLAFTIGLAVLTTLVSGALPAIQSSRADINAILKDDSRGASSFRIGRMSKALVVFEIALSCGLLVAAGLTIKSVAKLRTMDPGFAGAQVLTARAGFPSVQGISSSAAIYSDTVAQWQFFDRVLEAATALPGVQSAAISSALPAAEAGFNGSPFTIEGHAYLKETDVPDTRTVSVTPDFFQTLAVPLLQGRLFTSADRAGMPGVAVVTRSFADKYFSGVDPLGKRVRIGGMRSSKPWLTIVGVVGNVFIGGNIDPFPPAIFQPFAQAHTNFAYISIKTVPAPVSLANNLRAAVAAINPDIPLYWVQTLDQATSSALWFVRVFGTMFMIFGLVALFLAAVGLYAVMSFSVSRRTREVGIRMALGAQATDVIRMIFSQGLAQLTIGLGLGLAIAFAISSVMTVVLFDVQPHDPAIFGGVAVLLVLVGLLASLVPAKRATAIDPLVALRSD